jgi:hypothetical protein
MSDLPPQPQPVPPSAEQPDVQPTATQRFRERLWSLRAVIAVALASVIVGGLGGAALANLADHGDDRRAGPGRGGFQRGGPGGPPGLDGNPQDHRQGRDGTGRRQWPGGGGGVPPGAPPTTAPATPAPLAPTSTS